MRANSDSSQFELMKCRWNTQVSLVLYSFINPCRILVSNMEGYLCSFLTLKMPKMLSCGEF